MHKKLICKRNPILSVAEKLLIIKLIRYIYYLYIFFSVQWNFIYTISIHCFFHIAVLHVLSSLK